jgi:hypothetical protein
VQKHFELEARVGIGPKTTVYEENNARICSLIKYIRHALAPARPYSVGVHFGVHSTRSFGQLSLFALNLQRDFRLAPELYSRSQRVFGNMVQVRHQKTVNLATEPSASLSFGEFTCELGQDPMASRGSPPFTANRKIFLACARE